MNILLLSSITIPSYFNAGHHIRIFECSKYIQNKYPEHNCHCLDVSILNTTWMDLGRELYKKYDVIFIYCDFDSVDNFRRLLKYIREISPKVKIAVFGRLVSLVKSFFEKFELDAIAVDGDYECAIEEYILYLSGSHSKPKGLLVLNPLKKYMYYGKARYLTVEEFVFPDIDEIPYEKYYELYKIDQNRFCGIPNLKEFVVPISRGCPIGCRFCEVPILQGKKERRWSVESVIKYINDSYNKKSFDYVSFYSAYFTFDQKWVFQLCNQLRQRGKISWKCTTVAKNLSYELLKAMADNGCFRISIGLEILNFGKPNDLPSCKQQNYNDLLRLQENLKKLNIELNCFVILGLPQSTFSETKNTLDFLEMNRIRYRPTVYTPYLNINENANEFELQNYNRQLLINTNYTQCEKSELYKYIFGRT